MLLIDLVATHLRAVLTGNVLCHESATYSCSFILPLPWAHPIMAFIGACNVARSAGQHQLAISLADSMTAAS